MKASGLAGISGRLHLGCSVWWMVATVAGAATHTSRGMSCSVVPNARNSSELGVGLGSLRQVMSLVSACLDHYRHACVGDAFCWPLDEKDSFSHSGLAFGLAQEPVESRQSGPGIHKFDSQCLFLQGLCTHLCTNYETSVSGLSWLIDL